MGVKEDVGAVLAKQYKPTFGLLVALIVGITISIGGYIALEGFVQKEARAALGPDAIATTAKHEALEKIQAANTEEIKTLKAAYSDLRDEVRDVKSDTKLILQRMDDVNHRRPR